MLKKGKKRLFRIEILKNMLTYQHWRGIIVLHAHLNVGNILHEILILIKNYGEVKYEALCIESDL